MLLSLLPSSCVWSEASAEGGLRAALAPEASLVHCRAGRDAASSGWRDLSEGKESAKEFGCILGTYDLSYLSVQAGFFPLYFFQFLNPPKDPDPQL